MIAPDNVADLERAIDAPHVEKLNRAYGRRQRIREAISRVYGEACLADHYQDVAPDAVDLLHEAVTALQAAEAGAATEIEALEAVDRERGIVRHPADRSLVIGRDVPLRAA